jgi:aerobic carbon-monoxide dehydrogenase medium subunit
MYDFEYLRPTSLADAAMLLKAHDEAKPLAGGMTLVPTLKQRLARPSHLIDLGALPDLSGIKVSSAEVVIGAMTTHAAVARSADMRNAIPALANLAEGIGDPHVRHRGTVGGSIANNDPAADYPAAVLALNATIRTNERDIAADDFFTGMFETALEPGEIIVSVAFPVPEKAAYVKFKNPASRYAMCGVFVAKTKSGVRVAVTGAGPCVFRQTEMEDALARNWAPEALDLIQQSADGLTEDIHGTAEYRAHLVRVLAQRAMQAAG